MQIPSIDVYETKKKDAYSNMAIDEELLSSKNAVLRLYSWSPPAVSLGRFQGLDMIDKAFCKSNGIDIVRRLTGGKAVLHDDELTYCFIIDENLVPDSIIDSYMIISRALQKGLSHLDIETEIKENKKISMGPNCFNSHSTYELMVQGRKLIGSAQARLRNKLLQHGSILISVDEKKIEGCFGKTYKDYITLSDIKNISRKILSRSIIEGFRDEFGSEMVKKELSKRQIYNYRNLAKKYHW